MTGRFLLSYFAMGCVVFAINFYTLVRSGTLERMLSGEHRVNGKFLFGTLFLFQFLFWPLGCITNTIALLHPSLSESWMKWFRRTFIDRDSRFTQPQLPPMCGSYKMEPPVDGERSPSLSMCVRAKNHNGKHSNRDPRVPHDDELCPCTPAEWTDEESVCMHTYVRMCVKHGNHEGKCRTPEGEEFEPVTMATFGVR